MTVFSFINMHFLTLNTYHQYSPTKIVLSQQPNISYLRIFCCVVYVPILPPHCMKMSLQCRLGIYVSFNSSLIIRYFEPLTGDLFTICFANCYIDELIFLSLGNGKPLKGRYEFSWKVSTLSHLDLHTNLWENKVWKIVYLQQIAN